MSLNDIYNHNVSAEMPPSLERKDHWSVMNLEWSIENQKFDKCPVDIISGLPSNSERTLVPFPLAIANLHSNRVPCYRHPVLAEGYLGFIDCDHCVAADGTVSPVVRGLLKYLTPYAEYSVSGDGIHALCWLEKVPPEGHKDREWDLEFYWTARPIPVTGNRVVLPDWESPIDLPRRTQEFLRLHKARFPSAWKPLPAPPSTLTQCALSSAEILAKLFGEDQGTKWRFVYDGCWDGYYASPSDADLALLMKFAFYSGKDRQMMEAMFSAAPLSTILVRGTLGHPTKWHAPKWRDRKYRERTLDEAIRRTTSVYSGRKRSDDQEFLKRRLREIHANKQ